MTQSLGQSLIPPEKILPEAYEEAEEMDKIRTVELFGHTFDYAALSIKDGYSSLVEALIEDENDYTNLEFELGRNFLDKNYVFIDNLPESLHDQIGLHEHLEGRGLDDSQISHHVTCRDELRLLQENHEQYKNYAEFWVGLNKKQGKERFEKGGLFFYFGNLIPNLDSVIKEGNLAPSQIMKTYQDILEIKYKDIAVSCTCKK